jgi:cysteine desulfurase/selenocysteine lyase
MNRQFDVARVRADFPIFQRPLRKGLPLVYLDSAASAQKPRVVVEKVQEAYQQYYANAYRGVYQFGARMDEELEAVRSLVQRYINAAEPEEIIFTSGTTMSINMVAYAWGLSQLRAGDQLVLNEMEHHANFVPWQQIARKTGATCRFIPLTPDGQLDLTALDDVLTQRTRLVAVSRMSNVLGTINPIRELAARAHEVGARILVDAAQSIAHEFTDVRELNADFLAFSGHKIYGPSGIGILYGRRELLDSMEPFLFGGHMIAEVTRDASSWASLPAKFEAGTIPIVQAIGLGAAIRYVQDLGLGHVQAHERELLNHAHGSLSEVPGLKIYGPATSHKGAIVSFTIDGAHPEDLAQLLDRRGVFVRHGHHCTMPLHEKLGVAATVRASFGCYNTQQDVDALVAAIAFAKQKLQW